jgi:hypothetical protein
MAPTAQAAPKRTSNAKATWAGGGRRGEFDRGLVALWSAASGILEFWVHLVLVMKQEATNNLVVLGKERPLVPGRLFSKRVVLGHRARSI